LTGVAGAVIVDRVETTRSKHVLESEIKEQADANVYESEVGAMEDALPKHELISTTRRFRDS
jgi:hypothetical protein